MSSHVVLCRSEPVLPMLTFAQKRGNATFYEWRTGKVPTVIERPVVEEAPPDTISEDAVGFTVSLLCINQGHRIKISVCSLVRLDYHIYKTELQLVRRVM